MLQRGLSLLLSATLVACPFFCTLQITVAKAAGTNLHTCCDCCAAAHAANQPAPSHGSNHRPSNSGKSCQCICGGAVNQLSAPVDFGLDINWLMVLPAESQCISSKFDPASPVSIDRLQPDDGTNLGRSMRCLFNSFLC